MGTEKHASGITSVSIGGYQPKPTQLTEEETSDFVDAMIEHFESKGMTIASIVVPCDSGTRAMIWVDSRPEKEGTDGS